MKNDGLQPWGSSDWTVRVGELDPKTGYVPVRISNNNPRLGGPLFRDLPENWRQETIRESMRQASGRA